MSDITFDIDHGPGNARNSEGAFLRTASGRIRFVYSRYSGDDYYDAAAADLAEVYSDDNGETWKSRGIVIPRGDADNIMSVSLLRIAPDDVRIFYLEKRALAQRDHNAATRKDGADGRSSCVPMMRRSADDGETWSAPERIIPFDEYCILNNDRVIRLASGRIVMPIAHHRFRTGRHLGAGLVFTLYSDDDGNSWRESDTLLCPNFQAEASRGFQEPGIIELAPGHLWLWCRTGLGYQYTSHSYDGGVTWSAAVPDLNFPSPAFPAPMSVKRDPESGILYALWNGADRQLHPVLPHPLTNGRSPLTMIRSLDDGKTWERTRPVLLETDPERGYCYTAMEFLPGGELLLAYCCGRHLDGDSNLQDLRIRKIDVNELWKD